MRPLNGVFNLPHPKKNWNIRIATIKYLDLQHGLSTPDDQKQNTQQTNMSLFGWKKSNHLSAELFQTREFSQAFGDAPEQASDSSQTRSIAGLLWPCPISRISQINPKAFWT